MRDMLAAAFAALGAVIGFIIGATLGSILSTAFFGFSDLADLTFITIGGLGAAVACAWLGIRLSARLASRRPKPS